MIKIYAVNKRDATSYWQGTFRDRREFKRRELWINDCWVWRFDFANGKSLWFGNSGFEIKRPKFKG